MILAFLTGCQNLGVIEYWQENSIDYSDIDAAQDRFAVFAEKAVAAKEADATAALDVLFDKLKEDEVAYYLYTDWMDGAFYSPVSPCRSAVLYAKAVQRMMSDGIMSKSDCLPYLQRLEWLQYNQTGSEAAIPDVVLDGRRTLVLVLDLSCPSCREALKALTADRRWSKVRKVAICCGYGPEPIAPEWELYYPENPTEIFDPELTPVFFVVSKDGVVESTYKPAI